MSAQLQPVPFRKSPHSHRIFSEYENTIFARLHAGEISITAAMGQLQTGEVPLKRHYHQLYGERLAPKRPVHIWTEADRPALLEYSAGKVTLTTLCRDLHTSAMSIRKAMKQMDIAPPNAPAPVRDREAEPMVKGVWFAIARKEGKTWEPMEGAPLTVEEAHALREAGHALMAQKRVDGAMDQLVFIKAKGRKR